jgi:hypothetical protein
MSTYKVKFEKNNKMVLFKKKQKKEAKEIIEDSLPTFIEKNSGSGTIVKKKLVRLDLQGQFNDNSIRYANLQIQLNALTASDGLTDESEEEDEDVVTDGGGPIRTTIATVLMPSGEKIPYDIMKRAFNGSLDNGEKATIFRSN